MAEPRQNRGLQLKPLQIQEASESEAPLHRRRFAYSTQGRAQHKARNSSPRNVPLKKGVTPMSTATLYNWSNVENGQRNPLLPRQFVYGDQSMFARILPKKGCVVPRH